MKPRTTSSLFSLLVVFLMPVVLLSCDSGGSSADENSDDDAFSLDQGSFSATLENDGETTSLSGGAVFGVVDDVPDLTNFLTQNFDGKAFAIYMLDGERTLDDEGDVTGQFVHAAISQPSTTMPAEGKYAFFDEEGLTFALVDRRGGVTSLGGTFASSPGPGELEITTTSDDEIKGTFSYESTDLDIQVTGSFTAVRASNMDEIVLCAPGCEDS